jgi:hypothetical protein
LDKFKAYIPKFNFENMDAKTLDKLNSIQSSIEDLHNSQVAVMTKAAQLGTSLMNSPDKKVRMI